MKKPDLRFIHENLVREGVYGFHLSQTYLKLAIGPLSSNSLFAGISFKFAGKWMLNPQEDGRLDAKRNYVILAKALDGIWPSIYREPIVNLS